MSKIGRGNDKLSDVARGFHLVDLGQRSITPTTHESRDLFEDVADMIQTLDLVAAVQSVPAMDNSLFYQDIYGHTTWGPKKIIHFGINSYCGPIRQELVAHNAQQTLGIASLMGAVSNASSNTAQYKQLVPKIILTKHEQELISCAMTYLSDPVYKVVLVDTFPRALKPDATKSLKLGDIEVPQSQDQPLPTHTVVLYKNARGNVLVIDPSNPKFSGHLQHIGTNVLISTSTSELHKIYTPKGTPGPAKDLYRDCIDLSVKLAALLNSGTDDYNSVDEVMVSNVAHLVSNNKAITKIDIDQPLRIKQVSHLPKIKEINKELLEHTRFLEQKMKSARDKLDQEKALLQQIYDTEIAQADAEYEAGIMGLVVQVAADPELGGHYA